MDAALEVLNYLKSSSISVPLTLLISYGLYKLFKRKEELHVAKEKVKKIYNKFLDSTLC